MEGQQNASYYANEAANVNYAMDGGEGAWSTIGNKVVAPTVQAIPQLLASIALGPAGTTAQTATYIGPGISSALKASAETLIKNPMFWTSAAQTLGPSYDSAIEDGASQEEALLNALINTGLNSAVEVGGGIETLPQNPTGIR